MWVVRPMPASFSGWHEVCVCFPINDREHDQMNTHQEAITRARGAVKGIYRACLAASLALALAACGGGKSDESGPTETPAEIPTSRHDAARFLTQASFGPTDADIDRLMSVGYGAWIDEQFAKPRTSHRTAWEVADAAAKAINPDNTAGQDGVINSFWKQAISGEDQLRQRVVFALSEIFVISMQDGTLGDNP